MISNFSPVARECAKKMQLDVCFSKGREKRGEKNELTWKWKQRGSIGEWISSAKDRGRGGGREREIERENSLWVDVAEESPSYREAFYSQSKDEAAWKPPIAGNCLGPARFLRSRDRYTSALSRSLWRVQNRLATVSSAIDEPSTFVQLRRGTWIVPVTEHTVDWLTQFPDTVQNNFQSSSAIIHVRNNCKSRVTCTHVDGCATSIVLVLNYLPRMSVRVHVYSEEGVKRKV